MRIVIIEELFGYFFCSCICICFRHTGDATAKPHGNYPGFSRHSRGVEKRFVRQTTGQGSIPRLRNLQGRKGHPPGGICRKGRTFIHHLPCQRKITGIRNKSRRTDSNHLISCSRQTQKPEFLGSSQSSGFSTLPPFPPPKIVILSIYLSGKSIFHTGNLLFLCIICQSSRTSHANTDMQPPDDGAPGRAYY